MRNEIKRSIHFEQYAPNSLVIISLVYGLIAYYNIGDPLSNYCSKISSKFRIIKLWANIVRILSCLIIPVYTCLFFQARSLRKSDERQTDRDRQEERNDEVNDIANSL